MLSVIRSSISMLPDINGAKRSGVRSSFVRGSPRAFFFVSRSKRRSEFRFFRRITFTRYVSVSYTHLSAEAKKIEVEAICPEELQLPHDKKWTAEAIFNLLDNAVKYTPAGGKIRVEAVPQEMYTRIDVSDTGKGIREEHQAAVFRRFYREEEVAGIPGLGIGLYLTREIISQQGGYIRLTSSEGEGSVFSVYLLNKEFR